MRPTILFCSLLLLALPTLAQQSREAPYAIVQGVSGNGTAQIGVQIARGEALTFVVKPGGGEAAMPPTWSERIAMDGSDWEQVRLRFEGLEADVDHAFLVVCKQQIVDRRTFRVPDWSRAKGRILVASCLDDTFKEQAQMWSEVLAQEPDALFLIGDGAYCDVANGKLVRETTPLLIWQRHAETRSKLALYRALRLRPVFSLWDDHDYGLNDAGREFVHKRASARIFRAFFPGDSIDGFSERGSGMSSRFELFGQRWLFLDGRTYRSPNREEVPDETVFGERQEAWLVSELSQPQPLWIVTGAQFFGGYHGFESYESCQPRSFKKFLGWIRDGRAPVAFVSGDRHLAEVSAIAREEIGFASAEITTSALHARTFPDAWKSAPNPRQVDGVSGAFNYAVFDVESGATLRAKISIHGIANRKFFEYALDVKRGDG